MGLSKFWVGIKHHFDNTLDLLVCWNRPAIPMPNRRAIDEHT